MKHVCVYCGVNVRPGLIVCHAHSDLPALDPMYRKELRK